MTTFSISTTWDGEAVDSKQKVTLTFKAHPNGLLVHIVAPFYNDPKPPAQPGTSQAGLWEYEVVEVFFLNDKDQYLEVELCPHGQYLVLFLKGQRKCIKQGVPLNFTSQITSDTWEGEVMIPAEYFPSNVTRFNAFAIHGTGQGRTYQALYPASKTLDQPDFHRLEFFRSFPAIDLLPKTLEKSTHWEN